MHVPRPKVVTELIPQSLPEFDEQTALMRSAHFTQGNNYHFSPYMTNVVNSAPLIQNRGKKICPNLKSTFDFFCF